jgi:hypothetical protein
VPLAYAVQGGVALIALSALVLACRRRADAVMAMLPLATVLCSPFLLAYDLALLALPMAWLVREGVSRGFRAWDKPTLCAAFVAPLASILASRGGAPVVGPLAMGALFVAVTLACLRPPAAQR